MSKKKLYQLAVQQVRKSTADSVLVTLKVPQDLHEAFAFRAGQYLTLETEIGGEVVRRTYSLCAAPQDRLWRVGIKRLEGGLFSTFANERLKAGDTLSVMPPKGRFGVNPDPQTPKNYLAFAAGSGITPIFAIIKTQLFSEPDCTFKLFFVNRGPASIMLKEEIEALKNRFMTRLEVYHFFTREAREAPFFNGRIDREKLETIFARLSEIENIHDFFICGPEDFTVLIRDFLTDNQVEAGQIHMELFGTNRQPDPQKAPASIATPANGHCRVTLIDGGKETQFQVPRGSATLLEASLDLQLDLPFSCKGGVCSTCRARLLEGKVEMRTNYALEADELEAGFILTCQSVPLSETITVSFDG
ncbi:MAG TPA: 2Fe-2S iron-sulfur cluster-binding protein [Calditrichia bacterium]|nr:2Fe-2S iron-sulfur cluster-binding protein [Calditrichia bacterium]